jgi:hypothetical protein
MSMKLRSPVAALLAITEALLAAKGARSTRAKQASCEAPRATKAAKLRSKGRALFLRLKLQAAS